MKEEKMSESTISKDDVLNWIRSASMLELSSLVKEIEEEFGVSAAAPVAFAGGMPAGVGAAQAEAEEKTEFNVVLSAVGSQKIQVIKVVRAITGLGLKEAKDLVDNAPKPVKEEAPKEEAEKIKAQLEEVGATVELK
jgi:large subunit ribosomal protein L7/L12